MSTRNPAAVDPQSGYQAGSQAGPLEPTSPVTEDWTPRAMKFKMIRRLMLTDWYFHRRVLLAYIGGGAVSLALVAWGGEVGFYAGFVLFVTVLIGLGIHLPFSTVVEERKQQTLTFVMSLPISITEYTAAKLLSNLLLFLFPWLTLLACTATVIASREGMPNGLIPFATLLLVEIFAGSCLILGTALVSESIAWTVGAMIFSNLFFHAFLYTVAHLPGIAERLEGQSAAWSSTEILVLVGELAVIGLILGSTFVLQARKTDFL
ncbi:MAG: hypothetical protein SX243_04230 [Acidobacteriota bacterium]|nr:hypothetical protein [Acidobacteriota bacterium]